MINLDFSALNTPSLNALAQNLAYGATFFCLIRGIPVLIEGVRFFKQN